MLFSHVHVSSCVSGIFFPTVIQAWKFLLKLLGAPPNMFLTLVLPPSVPHANVLYKIVHEHMPMVFSALNVHICLRNARALLLFEVIGLDGLDILWTYAKLGLNFEGLKYLFRLLVALAPWTLSNLVVKIAFVTIARL